MAEPSDVERIGLRDELAWFAERMEEKLRANDYKGGWGWESQSHLLNRLRQETGELRRAVEDDDPERIAAEAADVANFAMMIADNARREP